MEGPAAAYARQALEAAATLLADAKPASRADLIDLKARLVSSRCYLDALGSWTDERSGESSPTLDDLRSRLAELAAVDSLAETTPHVEQAISDLNSRLIKPGSPLVDEFLRTAASGAPRPVRLGLASLIEIGGYGPPEARREQHRAIELAFRTALVVLPHIVESQSDMSFDLASTLRNLETCSGEYIAAILREEYCDLLAGEAASAATSAAAALEAAAPLERTFDHNAVGSVAGHAAATLRIAMRRNAEEAFALTRALVTDLLDLRGTTRSITERPSSIVITRLG